jgi:hypothetical protein
MVSVCSMKMVMLLAELNKLELCAGDIRGAHWGEGCIHCRIQVWTIGRSSNDDKLVGNTHGVDWFPSKADPDVWMKDCGFL